MHVNVALQYIPLLFCKHTKLFFFFLRIERLWCDVWSAVTSKYYETLHAMVEDGVLDLSNQLHLFCVHYTILPRLKSDLKCFIGSWNNHPIRTEANLTPNQLWHIGMLQTPVADPDVEVFFNYLFNVICI